VPWYGSKVTGVWNGMMMESEYGVRLCGINFVS